MRIAQIADFHFTHFTWNPFRLLSKRFLGNLNWLLSRKNHFSTDQLEPLPQLFQELKVDLVLLGGDFSTTALHEEFTKAKNWVAKISQNWIAIPGNHDNYTWTSYRKKHFYRYFSNPNATLFNLKAQGVEAHKIGPLWWVVALDTTRATNLYSSQGLFSPQLETSLEELLRLIPKGDHILLLNHYPFFQNDQKRRNLQRGEALQALIQQDPRIRIYLHGHTHRHTIADLQPNGLPLILDSGSCAQRRKGAWNLIDLTDQGCTVSTYRWDHHWTKTRTERFTWTRQT